MRYTENYNFNIPEDTDQYNEENYNTNFEIIDETLKEISDIFDDESEV